MPKIQLREMRIIDVHLSMNEQFSESIDNIEFEFGYHIESTCDTIKNVLLVKLMVATAAELKAVYPFHFNITIRGIFDVDANIDAALVDQLSKINCPAILFPFLREAVADLTRKAGFPPLYLPIVNFAEQADKERNDIENRQGDMTSSPKAQTKRSRKRSKQVKDQ